MASQQQPSSHSSKIGQFGHFHPYKGEYKQRKNAPEPHAQLERIQQKADLLRHWTPTTIRNSLDQVAADFEAFD